MGTLGEFELANSGAALVDDAGRFKVCGNCCGDFCSKQVGCIGNLSPSRGSSYYADITISGLEIPPGCYDIDLRPQNPVGAVFQGSIVTFSTLLPSPTHVFYSGLTDDNGDGICANTTYSISGSSVFGYTLPGCTGQIIGPVNSIGSIGSFNSSLMINTIEVSPAVYDVILRIVLWVSVPGIPGWDPERRMYGSPALIVVFQSQKSWINEPCDLRRVWTNQISSSWISPGATVITNDSSGGI